MYSAATALHRPFIREPHNLPLTHHRPTSPPNTHTQERELRAAQDAHARVQADVRGLLNDTVELVAAVSRTLKLAPADVHGMLSVVSERCGGGEGEGGGAGKVVMNEEEAREEEPQRWQQQVNYETMNAEPDDSEEEEAEPFHALSPQQMQRKGRAAPGLVEPSSLSGSRKRVKMQHQQQGKEEEEQGRGMVVEGEEGEREGEEGDDEDDEGSMYEEGGEEDSLAADEDGSSSESDDEPPVGRNGSRRR